MWGYYKNPTEGEGELGTDNTKRSVKVYNSIVGWRREWDDLLYRKFML